MARTSVTRTPCSVRRSTRSAGTSRRRSRARAGRRRGSTAPGRCSHRAAAGWRARTWRRRQVLVGLVVELLQVEDDLAGGLVPDTAAFGQQLGHRHAVEVGQLGQARNGHRAVAALVRADDDGLPAAGRLLLDALQRQALLLADGAQAGAEGLGVLRRHHEHSQSLARGLSPAIATERDGSRLQRRAVKCCYLPVSRDHALQLVSASQLVVPPDVL